jgi:hypothetical protein
MANINLLNTEVDTDPLGRGYAGMTDQQLADSLNAADRSRNRVSMSGDEVFQSLDSQATWDALTDAARSNFLSFCARDNIDPFGAANVALVTSIFGTPSATLTNLNNARTELVSRATELGIGSVTVGDVQYVRAN